jgi:excisionase family DNA binding protein
MNSDIYITNDSEPLLRASEVAARLNISRSLAYRLMQMGEIPTIKISKSIRVRLADLEEYINHNWSGWKMSIEDVVSK